MPSRSTWTSLSLSSSVNLSNYGILSIGIAGENNIYSPTVGTMLPYNRFKASTVATPTYAYWDPNNTSDNNKIMVSYINDTSIRYYCGTNFNTSVRLVILGWHK